MGNIGVNSTPHLYDTGLTSYGVVYSDNTGTLLNTAAGTIGYRLTSNGTSAPTFQAPSVGAATTYTPVLQFGGASTGITYGSQIGYYIQIGSSYFVTLTIVLTSKGTATGTATVSLPFAGNQTSILSISASGLTFTGQVAGRVPASATIFFDSFASGGARVLLTDTAFTNTTLFSISGIYY